MILCPQVWTQVIFLIREGLAYHPGFVVVFCYFFYFLVTTRGPQDLSSGITFYRTQGTTWMLRIGPAVSSMKGKVLSRIILQPLTTLFWLGCCLDSPFLLPYNQGLRQNGPKVSWNPKWRYLYGYFQAFMFFFSFLYLISKLSELFVWSRVARSAFWPEMIFSNLHNCPGFTHSHGINACLGHWKDEVACGLKATCLVPDKPHLDLQGKACH